MARYFVPFVFISIVKQSLINTLMMVSFLHNLDQIARLSQILLALIMSSNGAIFCPICFYQFYQTLCNKHFSDGLINYFQIFQIEKAKHKLFSKIFRNFRNKTGGKFVKQSRGSLPSLKYKNSFIKAYLKQQIFMLRK